MGVTAEQSNQVRQCDNVSRSERRSDSQDAEIERLEAEAVRLVGLMREEYARGYRDGSVDATFDEDMRQS